VRVNFEQSATAPRRFNMPILRFRSKEEQILVEAAEEKARQQAKYADEDWNSLSFNEKSGRVLTQVHRMEKK
jgi:galactose-1-phosphate uridylyltransferase